MKVLNFREWLEERGVLAEFLRERVNGGMLFDLNSLDPYLWMQLAFSHDFSRMGDSFWEAVDEVWSASLHGLDLHDDDDPKDSVELGMPADDPLGLALLLAELEDKRK